MISNSQSHTATIIDRRYEILSILGQGGTSRIYACHDRLTDRHLAIKQLNNHSPSDRLTDVSLAHEYATLGRLRHPNIIQVFDYSEANGQSQYPYYTMTLLSSAKTITEAAHNQPFETILNLFMQLLAALTYLHQHGLVHGDLKPANILVDAGRVALIDFGLVTPVGYPLGCEATPDYSAPERFERIVTAKPSIDLYAVGVIAYQLFSGHYPFRSTNAAELVQDQLYAPPDLSALPVTVSLRALIGRLLEKQADQRYQTILEVREALHTAFPHAAQVETGLIRESFWQAAPLIGRDAELEQLDQALHQVTQGEGGLWWIDGESGVGKTRLLDEVRIRAAVRGITVLRGQAAETGALPLQIWQPILRALCLRQPITDQDATVLKALVPDIETLLGRSVIDVPVLTDRLMHQRVLETIKHVLQHLTQPTLILLEDVQWAVSDLEVIDQLSPLLDHLPLCIIVTCRREALQRMPEQWLGFAHRLTLSRLTMDHTMQLGMAMVSSLGAGTPILSDMWVATEGNPFYLVEMIRLLTDQAGTLRYHVSSTDEPAVRNTEQLPGIHHLMTRHLGHISAADQWLIGAAAILGRVPDLKVLSTIAETVDLTEWLWRCADSGILGLFEGQWRFTHDKLRESVMDGLSSADREALHRQLANAIEQVYPSQAEMAGRLADYWHMAHETDKERTYSIRAAYYYQDHYPAECRPWLERALALTLGEESEMQRQHARLLYRMGRYEEQFGTIAASLTYYTECIALARQADDPLAVADAVLKRAYTFLISENRARVDVLEELEECLTLYRDLNDTIGIARTLTALGDQIADRGDAAVALVYYDQALAVFEQEKLPASILTMRYKIGLALFGVERYEAAIEQLQIVVRMSIEQGNVYNHTLALANQSSFFTELGQYPAARIAGEQALALGWEGGSLPNITFFLSNLAEVCDAQGEYRGALDYALQSVQLGREIGNGGRMAMYLRILAQIYVHTGQWSSALTALEEANQYRNSGAYTLSSYLYSLVLLRLARDQDAKAVCLKTIEIITPIVADRPRDTWGRLNEVIACAGLAILTDGEQQRHYLGQGQTSIRAIDGFSHLPGVRDMCREWLTLLAVRDTDHVLLPLLNEF